LREQRAHDLRFVDLGIVIDEDSLERHRL